MLNGLHLTKYHNSTKRLYQKRYISMVRSQISTTSHAILEMRLSPILLKLHQKEMPELKFPIGSSPVSSVPHDININTPNHRPHMSPHQLLDLMSSLLSIHTRSLAAHTIEFWKTLGLSPSATLSRLKSIPIPNSLRKSKCC